ncbi:MAG: nucleolar complex protein 14 [Bathelium mastoideum]|nr:MAG: nucleolar complex protein 14 [Bathelium mastoideum]
MPASQLKRLKASLRDQGITGPKKSKKQKKQARNGTTADKRVQRSHALGNIRESFNPFDVKAATRPRKFDVTTSQSVKGKNGRVILGRPGVTRSAGEEARRRLLLPEMQKKNRVGGIVDRRIGENNPLMTPEERALQRFTKEKQKRKQNVFDLEDAEDEEPLTHGGQTLSFGDENGKDDFDEDNSVLSDQPDSDAEVGGIFRKRKIAEADDGTEYPADQDEQQPARKKSKTEVMKEVIAKSKLHKYERQQAKEEDDDLREQLDKGLPDILAELRGKITQKPLLTPPAPEAEDRKIAMNPERAAMLNGASREEVEKRYDEQLRQMAQDRRAAPTERTKTEEERMEEEATRLKELEQERLRRMRGEQVEDEDKEGAPSHRSDEEVEDEPDDAAQFGFTDSKLKKSSQLVLDDEDEFLLEDDLLASDSDADPDLSGDEAWATAEEDLVNDAQEDDFIQGLLSKEELDRPEFVDLKNRTPKSTSNGELAYTYPCPSNHDELLQVLDGIPATEVPTIIRRIRTLYHPQLQEDYKARLAEFSVALVDHISYATRNGQSLEVVDTIIRHVHSLSRTFPEKIANAFRTHLDRMRTESIPNAGDLAILTAIGSIYPTSDHFHPVVTPAITIMAQWLGLSCVTNSPLNTDSTTGAALVALCLQYQTLSKRYIPEAASYTLRVLRQSPPLPLTDLEPHLHNLNTMATLWRTHSSFPEIFRPFLPLLQNPQTETLHTHLTTLIHASLQTRRPLQLHHHRPRAIPTATPRFEPTFDPTRHYDPDAERAAQQRLKREWARERKGALRELRRDASFVARERLREKRVKDAEYERKMKRLVAEVQGEEAREGKAYERVKRARKGKR